MRRMIQSLLPSMFYRRLLLLAVATMCVALLLLVQTFRLSVVQAKERRIEAERILQRPYSIPTRRGSIRDRRMRVLASDRGGWDLAVDYNVLTGRWAYIQARERAEQIDPNLWAEIGPNGRERLTKMHQGDLEKQIEQFWQALADLGALERDEVEKRRLSIVRWVQEQAGHVWIARQVQKKRSGHEVHLSRVADPIAEQVMHHTVLGDVDSTTVGRIKSMIDAEDPEFAIWKQVRLEKANARIYQHQQSEVRIDLTTLPLPLRSEQQVEFKVDGVGVHLVGAMRRVWHEDLHGPTGRPFHRKNRDGQSLFDLGGYLPGDTIGKRGIEQSQEDRLRGSRGRVVKHLDTGYEERLEPVVGRDVVLSIDIELQARLRAIMEPAFGLMQRHPWHGKEISGPVGEPLNGAAVVLDVASGEVLAAVSVPGYSLKQLRDEPETVWQDQINRPYVNRTVGDATWGVYEPGSTLKPLVMAAAITDGKLGVDETITCNGFLYEDKPDQYRCWIYKHFNGLTHGPLAPHEAIGRSCNIYFFTLGRRLGPRRVVQWYDWFGLGRPTGCGIREAAGDLPSPAEASPNARGFSMADAVFMAIGQGPVRWTPIQAASAYAALARGGYWISPTFLIAADTDQDRRPVDLELDPAAVKKVMQGLDMVVNDPQGTGHHINFDGEQEPIFNVPDVQLYGKSGTAQPHQVLRIDSNGDGRISREDEIAKHGDHSWFVVLAQRPGSSRPDYVVVVLVEFGGSGSRVAGPITNQVLHAMRTEGYL